MEEHTLYYFLVEDKLSIDDYIRLEQVASIENAKMKYKIFTVWDPNPEDPTNPSGKVYTSLN